MHLRIFELARDALHSDGFHVLGDYMSPVNDAYKKKGLLSAKHRLEMCNLACQSSDFVMVDPWEGSQSSYQRTSAVLSRVKTFLTTNRHVQPEESVKSHATMWLGSTAIFLHSWCLDPSTGKNYLSRLWHRVHP